MQIVRHIPLLSETSSRIWNFTGKYSTLSLKELTILREAREKSMAIMFSMKIESPNYKFQIKKERLKIVTVMLLQNVSI